MNCGPCLPFRPGGVSSLSRLWGVRVSCLSLAFRCWGVSVGVFVEKTVGELSALEEQINAKLSSGEAIDVAYWESLLDQLLVYMAKVWGWGGMESFDACILVADARVSVSLVSFSGCGCLSFVSFLGCECAMGADSIGLVLDVSNFRKHARLGPKAPL